MNPFKMEKNPSTRRGTSVGATLAALASAVLLLGSVVPAHAATGTVGTYGELGVTCFFRVDTPGSWGPNGWVDATYTSQILLATPLIVAAPVRLDPNISIVGPVHRQWVAFRTHLYVSNDKGQTWRYANDSSSWLLNIAFWPWQGADVSASYGNPTWYNAETKKYGYTGEVVFDVPDPGLYRIVYEFRWYADDQVSGGSDRAWAHTYSWYNTGSSLTMINANYCTGGPAYPNGN